MARHNLTYHLVSDSGLEAAKALGVAFRLSDDYVARAKGYGVELIRAPGEEHYYLPVPAVYVIGKDGMVDFQYVNPNYQVRLSSDVLLAAARAAIEEKK